MPLLIDPYTKKNKKTNQEQYMFCFVNPIYCISELKSTLDYSMDLLCSVYPLRTQKYETVSAKWPKASDKDSPIWLFSIKTTKWCQTCNRDQKTKACNYIRKQQNEKQNKLKQNLILFSRPLAVTFSTGWAQNSPRPTCALTEVDEKMKRASGPAMTSYGCGMARRSLGCNNKKKKKKKRKKRGTVPLQLICCDLH